MSDTSRTDSAPEAREASSAPEAGKAAPAARARAGARTWRVAWPWWVAMAAVVIGVLVLAGGTPASQRSDESRAQDLAESLKCLQCAGESVAASQAPLAQQFRDEIDRQLGNGASDEQIRDWFVERYGEEVLLDPPSSGLSALVWLLPVLGLLGAVGGLWLAFRRWRNAPEPDPGAERAPSVQMPTAAPTEEVAARPSRAAPERDPAPAVRSGPRWRTPAVVLGLAAFAAAATWLVVWGSSDRGSGGLTGGTGTASEEVARCQPLSRTDPEAAVECFDEILAQDPRSVDALTYRGWALVRSGEVERGREDLQRAVELDPGAADPHVFLAVAATDEGDFELAAQELREFWSNGPSEIAASVVASEGLERKVFFGLMSAPTRDCWQQAAQGGQDGPIDQGFLDDLGACLENVLASNPADRDARLSRALSHIGPESADPEAARALLDSLLAEDPDDADALALLVSLDLASGDLDAAEAGLDRLEELPRGTAAFLIGDTATLRSALDAARQGG